MRRIVSSLVVAFPLLTHAATWSSSTVKDRLTDSAVVTYTASSDNSFNFAFPYRGSTRALLVVRAKGTQDLDVLFLIERGQLMHDINDGEMRVRFDDGEITTFTASRSTSRDANVAFLRSEQRFAEMAAKAKRIRVEFTVFSNGTHVADFRFTKPLPPALATRAAGSVSLPVPATGGPAPIGASHGRRAERLEAREDECRTKKEFIECLVLVRACYEKVQSIEDEADCQEQVERFP